MATKKPAATKPKSAAKPPAKRKPARRRAATKAKPATGLRERGASVVSIFGAFGCLTMVQMPTSLAEELFGDTPLGQCSPTNVVDAIARDLEPMPEALSTSAIAAVALALGREIEHPYNSATSKSMCAARVAEIMGELRELCPPAPKVDRIDEVKTKRDARRRRSADA